MIKALLFSLCALLYAGSADAFSVTQNTPRSWTIANGPSQVSGPIRFASDGSVLYTRSLPVPGVGSVSVGGLVTAAEVAAMIARASPAGLLMGAAAVALLSALPDAMPGQPGKIAGAACPPITVNANAEPYFQPGSTVGAGGSSWLSPEYRPNPSNPSVCQARQGTAGGYMGAWQTYCPTGPSGACSAPVVQQARDPVQSDWERAYNQATETQRRAAVEEAIARGQTSAPSSVSDVSGPATVPTTARNPIGGERNIDCPVRYVRTPTGAQIEIGDCSNGTEARFQPRAEDGTVNGTTTTVIPGAPAPKDSTEQPDFCAKNPNAAACRELGTETGEVDKRTWQFTFNPVQLATATGCPADVSFTVFNQSAAFSYGGACSLAQMIAPFITLGGLLVAGLILFGAWRS